MRSQTTRVVVAGHMCMDIAPAFGPMDVQTLSHLLSPGKLVHIGAAALHNGGCVANTGLALHRLGVPVRLMAKVGNDAFAGMIRDQLRKEDVDFTLVTDAESSTSYTIIIAPPNVDRIFLHNPGANERFSEADVSDELLRGAEMFHFGYPPLMLRLCRNGGEELLRLFTRVRAFGLSTSLDMAAVDPASEAGRVDWLALMPKLMKLTDFFLPSAEELCYMLDKARHAEWLSRCGGGDVTETLDIRRDIVPLADRLMEMGCRVLVIKCGARGLYYRTASAEALSDIPLPLSLAEWANREGFQPSFRPDRIVSASGAGDTSIAAYLASVLEGCGPERCAQRAAATGACCVEAGDTLSGLLPLAQLDKRIAAGWAVNG